MGPSSSPARATTMTTASQRVVVDLPAGEDAAVDDGHLGADGKAHGGDEAQNEDPGVAPLLEEVLETGRQQGEMAPLLQKLLHVVPCFSVGRHRGRRLKAVILGERPLSQFVGDRAWPLREQGQRDPVPVPGDGCEGVVA